MCNRSRELKEPTRLLILLHLFYCFREILIYLVTSCRERTNHVFTASTTISCGCYYRAHEEEERVAYLDAANICSLGSSLYMVIILHTMQVSSQTGLDTKHSNGSNWIQVLNLLHATALWLDISNILFGILEFWTGVIRGTVASTMSLYAQ